MRSKWIILLDDIEFGDDFSGFRNRIIIETFYNTGMRLSELINLQMADVDLSAADYQGTWETKQRKDHTLEPRVL